RTATPSTAFEALADKAGERARDADPLRLDCGASGVSYFAQIPHGQRRRPIIIDTPSQGVRSSIHAESEPIRVSVASLRNMSGERKYHASTFNPSRRLAETSAARCSRGCRRNYLCWLLLGRLVARQHRHQTCG